MQERQRSADAPSREERAVAAGYEHSDAQVRPLILFALALGVGLVVLAFAMHSVFGWFLGDVRVHEGPPHPMAAPSEPPPPRLQAAPALDLEALRTREDELLHGYGWVDPAEGIVRIPIERAMELVVERGLPVRK
jgi:hypothetical protein